MSSLSLISMMRAPWVTKTQDSVEQLLVRIRQQLGSSLNLVVLDGQVMQTIDLFYAELIDKLRLPDYFGRNLNALEKCICELEWLENMPFVVVVGHADAILAKEPEVFCGFIEVMQCAGEEWSRPIAEGTEWDRPAIPFHVVLSYSQPEAFLSSAVPELN